jgi:8-oxo-dGTP diphosphatase
MVETAVHREAKEETGLDIELCDLVGIYSDPLRDPRGHIVSIAFAAKGIGNLKSGSDARSAKIFPVDRLPPLAFDHDQIIRDALKNTKASRTITLK